jgi:hypothetical protein
MEGIRIRERIGRGDVRTERQYRCPSTAAAAGGEPSPSIGDAGGQRGTADP